MKLFGVYGASCLFILLMACLLMFIYPIMLYLVWNWVVVVVFAGATKITFLQSFVVCLVLSIIGGFFRPRASNNNK